jgi:hypothetical protein
MQGKNIVQRVLLRKTICGKRKEYILSRIISRRKERIDHNMEAGSTFGKGISVVFPGSTFSSFSLSSDSTFRSQEGHYNLACKEFNDSF